MGITEWAILNGTNKLSCIDIVEIAEESVSKISFSNGLLIGIFLGVALTLISFMVFNNFKRIKKE